MADLDYAKVTGRFGLTVGDTLSDVDDDPDTVWCDSGRVLITPLNTFLKVAGATGGPFTAGGAVIEAQIGPDGRLLYQGKNYLYVVDLTSSRVNPQIAAGKATHKVTFSEVMAGTTRVDFPEFTCRLTAAGDGVSAGGVNDLTVVAPVQPGAASPIYRGEQGTGIAAASIVGGTNLQLQLTDGTTLNAGALPVGPGGSDAGVAGYMTTPGSQVDQALKASIAQIKAWARNPDLLIAGAVTRDANGAATSAPVAWPDGTPGTYTATTVSTAFPGAVDGYTITYGSPVTKTYTQPTITRDATTGAATNVPAITVT